MPTLSAGASKLARGSLLAVAAVVFGLAIFGVRPGTRETSLGPDTPRLRDRLRLALWLHYEHPIDGRYEFARLEVAPLEAFLAGWCSGDDSVRARVLIEPDAVPPVSPVKPRSCSAGAVYLLNGSFSLRLEEYSVDGRSRDQHLAVRVVGHKLAVVRRTIGPWRLLDPSRARYLGLGRRSVTP